MILLQSLAPTALFLAATAGVLCLFIRWSQHQCEEQRQWERAADERLADTTRRAARERADTGEEPVDARVL